MEIASLVMSVDARPVKKASEELSKFTKQADATEKATGRFSKSMRDAGSSGSALNKVLGITAGLLSARQILQAAESWVTLNNRLRLVTDSTNAFNSAQENIFRIAQETRQGLTATAELYQRIATNQKELNLTGQQTAGIVQTINQALVISGTSAAGADAALVQLGQAFASGTLRGEELNAVLEQAPALAQAIARGMGVTVGQLRALGAEGVLTADSVVKALQSQADAVEKQFLTMTPTVSGALKTLDNSFIQLIGRMDESTGASANASGAISDLADILSDPKTIEAANHMAAALATAFGAIVKSSRWVVENIQWMSEEAAVAMGGIGGHDIDRLEAEATRLQNLLSKMQASGDSKYPAFKAIVQDLDEVNAKIESYYKTLQSSPPPEVIPGGNPETSKVIAKTGVAVTALAKANKEVDDGYQALYDSLYPAEAAQRQYNEQVALLSKYLTGDKLAAAISKLNESIGDGDHDAAAKAVEDYRKEVEQLEDRLDPVGKATKQYQKDVALLASAHARGELSGEKYAMMLKNLEEDYKKASEASSEWAQWTESALERVDGAFADAWKNIGDGFSGFRDSLTNAFKQMLAELAHMAITKPIVMQIGAALGIGGGSSGGGLLSSVMGGGSGGGMDFGKLLNYGQSIYSGLTGVGPAVLAGYQSGGIGGALSGGAGYYGNLAGNAASTVGGWFGMGGGAAASSAAAQAAGAAAGNSLGVNAGAYAAQGGAGAGAGLSGLGALAGPAAAAFAALQAYKAYGDGVRLDAKDTRGNAAAWATGYQPLAEISGAVSKLTEALGIGGALGNILNIPSTLTAMVGSALFGGGWQTKDSGLAFSVANGGFVGESFEYQKKKGGLFGSNKKRTNFSPLDAESAAQFQDAFAATEGAVADIFEQLSYTITEASLAGLNLERTLISTQGKTEEEVQKAIAEWFGTAADAMTAELNKVFGTGLDLDFAGMQTFVNNLKGVNEVLRYLNVDMYESTVAGGKLAESLSAAAGGLEALAQNSQTYYDAFFTEAEKVEDTVDAITRAFESADVTLAGSRAEYRAMVEDIDLTTEAGREMFATMMALSGQAATYYSIVEQQAAQATAAANAALFGAVDTAYAALQRSIAAQQQEIQRAASATTSNINALTGVSNSLDAALKRLRGTSDETVKSLRAQAVMTLNSALVSARAGNSLAGFEGLQDALDTASQMDTDLYATLADFEREQGRTANLIAELEKVNGKQLTTEQQMLRSLESQLSALDQQLAFAQAQLDALNGIDKSVKSVEAAVAAMNASVVAALSGMADGLASKNTAANNSALIDSVYKSVLGRETDDAGKAFWQQQLASGNLDYDQLAKAIANDASKNANDPGAGSAADYLGSQGGLSVQDQVEAAYRATLGRSADIAGESYWMGLINSGAMTVSDLAAAIQLDAKVNGEIPGFAAGGFHSGGLRLVGENGPEIEATGPSRIFNAGQTADMLGGGSQADEVAAMRAEMTDALRAIAKHTQQTARRVEYLERWDFDGLPEQRAAV